MRPKSLSGESLPRPLSLRSATAGAVLAVTLATAAPQSVSAGFPGPGYGSLDPGGEPSGAAPRSLYEGAGSFHIRISGHTCEQEQ